MKKLILILILVSLPFAFLFAKTVVFFEVLDDNVYLGDIFLVKVKLSTDKSINVVDGKIVFDNKKILIEDVSIGGSIFTLWKLRPTFSNVSGNISLIGGVPGGFTGEGEIMKIFFKAIATGSAKIDFQDDFALFLNDGKGTQINTWLRPINIEILGGSRETPRDELREFLINDQNPPEPFEIKLGKDPLIYNNQYFITFFTIDKETGIDRYEVQEGDGEFIVAESPYLLRDQSLQKIIRVKAVDKAGNSRVVELTPKIGLSETVKVTTTTLEKPFTVSAPSELIPPTEEITPKTNYWPFILMSLVISSLIVGLVWYIFILKKYRG